MAPTDMSPPGTPRSGLSPSATAPARPRHGQAPACFGKLPARADFISRRLPHPTIAAWDAWLQACLARSQQALGAAWHDHYFTAPAWRFALPAKVCGQAALIGVVLPSVDAVGRCFPLLIAHELTRAADPVSAAIDAEPWFAAAEQLALDALEDDFDLGTLNRLLPAIGISAANARAEADAQAVGCWIELPMLAALPAALRQASCLGRSPALWWTGGGADFRPALAVTAELIPPYGFAALLDGDWRRHGWAGSNAQAEADLAWDRE